MYELEVRGIGEAFWGRNPEKGHFLYYLDQNAPGYSREEMKRYKMNNRARGRREF